LRSRRLSSTTSLYTKRSRPFEVYEVELKNATDRQLNRVSRELAVGLSLEEMKKVRKYFAAKNRNPTDLELQTIGQTWSEHCYHKTFKGEIIVGKRKIKSLFKTYIAKVTKELKPSWCVSVFEDNAGIVDFDRGFGIAVKVETHNHPSAIEPFGGAATGVGGVIRDILGVWADPIASMDVLGFGPLDYEYAKLPPGIKHPKYVYSGVVAGIGAYGNNMGIPTVNGAIYFDQSYVGNVVVYCGCVGILPIDKFVRKTSPDDLILLAGGKTGRDGIHGVTFASAELTEKSEEISRPAVQIANPIEEEKLKRAVIEIRDNGLGSGITDLGGGGLSSAVGERAYVAHCGAYVELDRIPLKYPGLAPWEIYVSESQERMLLSIPKGNLYEVLSIFEREDVEATVIGRFIKQPNLLVKYQSEKLADIGIDFLFEPPTVKRTARARRLQIADDSEPHFKEPSNYESVILSLLSAPNIASKERVVRTYDHEVKGSTVIKPLQGPKAGPSDAAILKPVTDSWKGIVISNGLTPNYGKISSYWMAAASVDEAIRNNTAVGGRRIALLDNFTWGNPERPDRLGSLVQACQACYDVAKGFETPFISGKDSLYNESPLGSVTPTLLITAVGVIPDVRKAVTMDLKKPGNLVYLVGLTLPELGGSEYYRLKGELGNTVPHVDPKQGKRIADSVVRAIDAGYVRTCHDLSEGGLAVAAAEVAFTGNYGLDLHLKDVVRPGSLIRNDFILFSESASRFLIEVPTEQQADFEETMHGCSFAQIGRVTDRESVTIHGANDEELTDISTSALRKAWKTTLGAWQYEKE
jgi:phosphoribosylformylglycinamidine synthase II